MDNQESETITGQEVTATLLPPNNETWSGGLHDLWLALDKERPATTTLSSAIPAEWSNSELAMVLRGPVCENKPEREALARLLESAAKEHDLLASGEMRWRGLCERAYAELRRIFVDLMEQPSECFQELRAIMLELRAALGLGRAQAVLEGPPPYAYEPLRTPVDWGDSEGVMDEVRRGVADMNDSVENLKGVGLYKESPNPDAATGKEAGE